MNNVWTVSDLQKKEDFFIKKALEEKVFIYPTDTIYGIGGIVCESVISKIDTRKNRPGGKFYSIIAPSFEWIDEYFDLPSSAEFLWKTYTKKNTYITLILKHKENTGFPFHLLSSNNTIGVRILNHPFQQFVSNLGQPFITTSCNKSGKKAIISVDQIDNIFEGVIINGGVLEGSGSAIFDVNSGERVR